MQDNEENINFHTMPDFGSMLNQSKQTDWEDEKVYDTLFDELAEKCHPNRFLGDEHFDEYLFNKANRFYAELQKKKGESDENLLMLRNQAMEELGIHISTKKKYDYLMRYLSPEVYVDMQPYDEDRVAEAGKWYALLKQRKSDIVALEQLELNAKDFISKRKKEEVVKQEQEELKKEKQREEEKKQSEDKRFAIFVFITIIVVILLIAVAYSGK